MTEIVNLDDLVPPDVELTYRGKKYVIDGDTSVEDVFRLFALYRELAEAQAIEGNDEEQVEKVKAAFGRVQEHILKLLQKRTPDLDESPFGMKGTMEVIKIVLSKLGLGIVEDDDPPTPRPARKRAAISKASTRTKSPASTPRRRKTVAGKKK